MNDRFNQEHSRTINSLRLHVDFYSFPRNVFFIHFTWLKNTCKFLITISVIMHVQQ
ncbi:MAG: hypothetical protein ACTSYS_11580 [Promethearchaeota archaeon]